MYLKDRRKERYGMFFCQLVHSQNEYKSCGWARAMAKAGIPIQISHPRWQGPKHLSCHLSPPGVHIGKKLEWGAWFGFKPRHLNQHLPGFSEVPSLICSPRAPQHCWRGQDFQQTRMRPCKRLWGGHLWMGKS